MATPFPAIAPTSRSYKLGSYPVKRFTSISGTGVSRLYGSQPSAATLDLEFGNKRDAVALAITTAYEDANGSFGELSLPSEVWAGMDRLLQERLQRDYTWRFSERPTITAVKRGLSTIQVTLEGQRDG
jgi:hypothetical protein